jgi:hypothetical protein
LPFFELGVDHPHHAGWFASGSPEPQLEGLQKAGMELPENPGME